VSTLHGKLGKSHLATAGARVPRGEEYVQEFQTFYQENLGLIYRYVYSKVGNREEAEDLTSQIFLKAVRDLDLSREAYSTKTWLFQVARTTIADYWRVHYRVTTKSLEDLLEAGWEGPAEAELLARSERSVEWIQRILQALPERYRKVLIYRFLLKLSVKDTAVSMGGPPWQRSKHCSCVRSNALLTSNKLSQNNNVEWCRRRKKI